MASAPAVDPLAPRSLPVRVVRGISWRLASVRSRVRDHLPPVSPIVREIAEVTGRSLVSVAADVLETWARRGWQPPEYAALRLWTVPRERRDDFLIAKDIRPFLERTLSPDDLVFGRDKVECAEHARRHGVPWIPTLAVIHRREGPRIGGGVISVERPGDLWPVLERLTATDDIVLKPAFGLQGKGFIAVLRDGRVCDGDGHPVARSEVVKRVFEYSRYRTAYGYLAQPLLRAHPSMVALTGVDALATVRIVTVRHATGNFTIQSFLKIPAPGRLTDNFRRGVSGTLIAPVDPVDGRLGDLLGLVQPGRRYVIERTAVHPRTGKRISGSELPAWRECFDVAARAAAAHPDSPLFGWDVGYGPQGWVILEANSLWGPVGAQSCTGQGLRPVLARLYPDDWA